MISVGLTRPMGIRELRPLINAERAKSSAEGLTRPMGIRELRQVFCWDWGDISVFRIDPPHGDQGIETSDHPFLSGAF